MSDDRNPGPTPTAPANPGSPRSYTLTESLDEAWGDCNLDAPPTVWSMSIPGYIRYIRAMEAGEVLWLPWREYPAPSGIRIPTSWTVLELPELGAKELPPPHDYFVQPRTSTDVTRRHAFSPEAKPWVRLPAVLGVALPVLGWLAYLNQNGLGLWTILAGAVMLATLPFVVFRIRRRFATTPGELLKSADNFWWSEIQRTQLTPRDMIVGEYVRQLARKSKRWKVSVFFVVGSLVLCGAMLSIPNYGMTIASLMWFACGGIYCAVVGSAGVGLRYVFADFVTPTAHTVFERRLKSLTMRKKLRFHLRLAVEGAKRMTALCIVSWRSVSTAPIAIVCLPMAYNVGIGREALVLAGTLFMIAPHLSFFHMENKANRFYVHYHLRYLEWVIANFRALQRERYEAGDGVMRWGGMP